MELISKFKTNESPVYAKCLPFTYFVQDVLIDVNHSKKLKRSNYPLCTYGARTLAFIFRNGFKLRVTNVGQLVQFLLQCQLQTLLKLAFAPHDEYHYLSVFSQCFTFFI